jgi:hypothetical protein
MRIPAYTDRILFKPNNNNGSCGVQVMEYNSIEDAIHSDHRPVYASLVLSLIGKDRRKKVKSEDTGSVRLSRRKEKSSLESNNGTSLKKGKRKHKRKKRSSMNDDGVLVDGTGIIPDDINKPKPLQVQSKKKATKKRKRKKTET